MGQFQRKFAVYGMEDWELWRRIATPELWLVRVARSAFSLFGGVVSHKVPSTRYKDKDPAIRPARRHPLYTKDRCASTTYYVVEMLKHENKIDRARTD